MSVNQFISVRETAQLLGITEKKVMDLVDERKLKAYRIADQFLRLKKTEVVSLRNTGTIQVETVHFNYSTAERIKDFIFFNDFYLIAFLIILSLLYIIFFL